MMIKTVIEKVDLLPCGYMPDKRNAAQKLKLLLSGSISNRAEFQVADTFLAVVISMVYIHPSFSTGRLPCQR